MADSAILGYAPQDLVVRYTGDASTLIVGVRGIVERVDPEQPISNGRSMEDIVADQTALAYAAGRGLRTLLASVEPVDLPSFGIAIGLCILAAVPGSVAPMLRALGADPMLALRAE